MPNIEIKAKCHNLEFALQKAKQLSTEYVGLLHQLDTYYKTQTGRLKLREINGLEAQLIPYHKDYSTGPMKSNYDVLPSTNPQNLKSILKTILGEVAIVDKNREVYLIDNVRVHLDKVKGLGEFIEFEAVYEEKTIEDKEREVSKVNELMKVFEIQEEDLLDRSYIDYFLDDQTKKIEENQKALYFFDNQDFSLIEVEKLDCLDHEPLDKKYFWLMWNKKTKRLQRLEFTSMEKAKDYQTREFRQGKLKFDNERATCTLNDQDIRMNVSHPMFASNNLKTRIMNFL